MNQKNISQPTLYTLVDHDRKTRRDSIPEEIEEEKIAQLNNVLKNSVKKTDQNKANKHNDKDRKQRNSWHSDDNNPT